MESEESSIQKLSELNRIHSRMEPAGYLDKVYGLFLKSCGMDSHAETGHTRQTLPILEKDYKRTDLSGRDTIARTQSECALLTQKPPATCPEQPADRLELAAAALLHDYDPLRIDGARTAAHGQTHHARQLLTHTLADMELDPLKIALLISAPCTP